MEMITSFWKPARKFRKCSTSEINVENVKNRENNHPLTDVVKMFRRPPQRSQSLKIASSSKNGSGNIKTKVLSSKDDLINSNKSSTQLFESNRLFITEQDLIIYPSNNELQKNSQSSGTSLRRVLVTQRPNNFSHQINLLTSNLNSKSDHHHHHDSNNGSLDHDSSREVFHQNFFPQNCSMTLSKYEFIKRRHQHCEIASVTDVASQSVEQLSPLKCCTSNSSSSSTSSSKNCSDASDIDCLKSGSYGSVGDDEGINLVSCNDDCPEEIDSSEDDFDWDLDETENFNNKNTIGTRRVFLTRPSSSGSLGFTIQGGAEFGLPVIISSIRSSSLADVVGSIFKGDLILSVNGVTVDESTTHLDAKRLLSECGDFVCLVLRHSKCSNQMKRRRWRGVRDELLHEKLLFSKQKYNSEEAQTNQTSSRLQLLKTRQSHLTEEMTDVVSMPPALQTNHPLSQRSCSASCLSHHYWQIDLFMTNVSRFISYSNQKRHASIELRSVSSGLLNGNEPLIIQCSTEELACEWFSALDRCIESQLDNFISFYNSHFHRDEHIHFMGWLCERIPFDEDKTFQTQKCRWLLRFAILKSGKLFLFKSAPVDMIRDAKQHLIEHVNSQRRPTSVSVSTTSNTSSLVSVGSTSSNETDNNENHFPIRRRSKNELRSLKINSVLMRNFHNNALFVYECYRSDFELVKVCKDLRDNCFIVYGGNGQCSKHYFSCDVQEKAKKFETAWFKANFDSVFKNKCKTFAVQLEKNQLFGSLNIDWHRGLSFYNPRTKSHEWAFQFEQIKHIEDDNTSLLLLTFAIPNCKNTVTHILRCSNLMSVVYCINAFLAAKLYALNNFDYFCK